MTRRSRMHGDECIICDAYPNSKAKELHFKVEQSTPEPFKTLMLLHLPSTPHGHYCTECHQKFPCETTKIINSRVREVPETVEEPTDS